MASETTPLLRETQDPEVRSDDTDTASIDSGSSSSPSIWSVLPVLFIGKSSVFVSQADTSLVLATYAPIASEFNDFDKASWLLSSYMLAMCVAQPLYGKLSDIFGRKTLLQVSYALFAVGSGLCGIARSMGELIASRALQGVGGAGMVCLVSILITDICPMRDVASYRSYINVVQTVGRSSGGAIGGLLADTIGWRSTLAGQAPITLIGMALVAWKLHLPAGSRPDSPDDSLHNTKGSYTLVSKLRRVDIGGALLLSTTILPILFVLDAGGTEFAWLSPTTLVLLLVALLSGLLFSLVETRYAAEPIFPLSLLSNRAVLVSYLGLALQNASQTAVMFLTPLYFQVAKGASTAEAGTYMVPSVLGNTAGGLATGLLIRRYGRTKSLLSFSALSSGLCYSLLLLVWTGRNPGGWQSILVFPGGVATAMAHSAIFVVVAAGVSETDMAIAGSGLYLSGSFGGVAGICGVSALFQARVYRGLVHRLLRSGIPRGSEIMRRVLGDVTSIWRQPEEIRNLVIAAYVDGFRASFFLCLAFAGICLVLSVLSPEKRLV
ncbi:major facilitator superfamily domain-containing protein [Emericellopsis atlantica]|uniref:Major facilitator superfamily domain-containing protein n=1 Tax=Emericellopsis atlantica TaxID=2614577 RepID=A0A9P7ZNQ2_9HYPO|nr:major facilitator superfamily domain-containing protein [Emericellopsis atlantica]KAG9254868.1 major facilitator superfamily domain-containing protein [Emericellopsis atlantica]